MKEPVEITKEMREKYIYRFVLTEPLTLHPFLYRTRYTVFMKPDVHLETSLISTRPSASNKKSKEYVKVRGLIPDDLNLYCNKENKIIGKLRGLRPEDLKIFPILFSHNGYLEFFDKSLVDVLQSICPNDFVAIPLTLKITSDEGEKYTNNDYYIIHPLNTIDALDRKKSVINFFVGKRVYKEDPWQGHLIAYESTTQDIIFHPDLAVQLYPGQFYHFLTPAEDSFWWGGGLPEDWDREDWIEWMHILHPMAMYGGTTKDMPVMAVDDRYVFKPLLRLFSKAGWRAIESEEGQEEAREATLSYINNTRWKLENGLVPCL